MLRVLNIGLDKIFYSNLIKSLRMHQVSLLKEKVAHEDAFLFIRSSAASSGDYRGGSFNIAVILTLVTSHGFLV